MTVGRWPVLLAFLLTMTSQVVLTTEAQAATPVAPAPAPPMGWNSWNRFACNIDESLIKATADSMVAQGLDRLGYKYVNIDDCWMAPNRDAGGRLQAHPTRFPSGIKALADYVHAKGLKLGIYESAGTMTCAGFPGSLDHEVTDANSFAEWGVDYLKYDNCHNLGRPALQRYLAMGNALKATGRPIVYSLCNWGEQEPWLFGPSTHASLWRTTGDITDNWGSALSLLDQQVGLEPFATQSGWNDPDMLEVGNGGMTDAEYRSHFSLWSLLNSPLLLGNDLRSLSPATKAIIGNADVIAVNQDWGGSQGRRICDLGEQEIWAKPMSDGSVAVVLFNRGSAAAAMSTTAAEIGIAGSSTYGLKNLWTGGTSTTTGAIGATVPAHDVAMYRVTRSGTLAAGLGAGTHRLGDIAWSAEFGGWGPVERNRSNGELAGGDGRQITIGGTAYTHGIGTHSDSAVHVYPGRNCTNFTARVGVDGEVGALGGVRFQVYGDGRLLAYSDVRRGAQAAAAMTVGIAGVSDLELRVTDGRDGPNYDHADWADATVTCTGTAGTGRYVSDLPWQNVTNGWGSAERDQSNGELAAGDGNTLTVAGISFPRGVGVHPASDLTVANPGCSRFTALAGVDAEVAGRGTVRFSVLADGVTVYTSPVVNSASGVPVDVDISGRSAIRLVVDGAGDGIDFDHADWAGAQLRC